MSRPRRVPETPSALRKYGERADVGAAERARIGCTLVLAQRLADLDATLSRVLEVMLKGSLST